MHIGKNYMIHCVDYVTMVGTFAGWSAPGLVILKNASKIHGTNNDDNWHVLAQGDEQARREASYCHDEPQDEIEVSVNMVIRPWKGLTPYEAGLPDMLKGLDPDYQEKAWKYEG